MSQSIRCGRGTSRFSYSSRGQSREGVGNNQVTSPQTSCQQDLCTHPPLSTDREQGEIDPDELDYDIRKGDTIYGTTPMIHLIIVGLIKSVDAQKELLTIDCSTSLPLAFGDIKLVRILC